MQGKNRFNGYLGILCVFPESVNNYIKQKSPSERKCRLKACAASTRMKQRAGGGDRAERVGCSTCGDDAQGKAASLVKVLAGDCEGGGVDQTTAQACRTERGENTAEAF